MSDIVVKTIGECWLRSISKVMQNGKQNFDEDVEIMELLGLSVKILSPKLQDDIVDKFGDKDIVSHTLDKFKKGVIMPNRPFTYADQIYNKNGIDQFEYLIKRLEKKKESKSATISLLSEGVMDANLPCLNIIDIKIRDEKLNLQFFFRSQNILGRQYANLLALAKFQADLAKRVCIKTGFIAGYIASAHIYEYDYEYAKSIIANKNITIKDKFYTDGPKSIRENLQFKGN
ncbi:thymidylate synthase [Campylobacter gastrosuis]|uniref:Thymidylate synthase n=1 Tax=Campylobacter gastrosuis TaxID=2974576 RepID=A0ABT7HP70_9BACT|nr:thymidylate synthase [Campylobacter gastrosuis]MDL0088686.1 thymidylate synthase [Campylobacter gastrosuis]